jgi:hypothetical protein
MPTQQAFLDQPHPAFAPYLHIAEIAGDHLVFRLMGTALVERWGTDKTGEMIGKDQPDDIRDALFQNTVDAYAIPCGFWIELEFASITGAEMAIEAIVLPLAVAAGRPGRLVSYSDVLHHLPHGEHSDRYLDLPDSDWIDLGAGVPDHPIMSVPRA